MEKYNEYIKKIVSERNIDAIPFENLPQTSSFASLRGSSLLKCVDDCMTLTYEPMFGICTQGLPKMHMDLLLKNLISALKEDIYNVGKQLPKLSPWDDSKVRNFLRGSIDNHSILFKLSNNTDLLEKIVGHYLPTNEDRYIQHSLDILSIFPKNKCSIRNIKDFGKLLTRMGEFLSVVGSFESDSFVKNDVRI